MCKLFPEKLLLINSPQGSWGNGSRIGISCGINEELFEGFVYFFSAEKELVTAPSQLVNWVGLFGDFMILGHLFSCLGK